MEKGIFNATQDNINSVKNIAEVAKTLSKTETDTTFKVVSNNLPEKTSFWTKVKNTLFYEIKVELTPYEQKVEDEINEFLHQEITWEKVHDFLFQDITFGKKK